MPPSPGRIHSLPIKVLYSLDNSSQSYLTTLNDRHDVYVHPATPLSGEESSGGLGSCYLKGVAWGVCFASPECVPNVSSHDFSVYNLDPLQRPRSQRPFPSTSTSASPSSSDPSSSSTWTGKGFLSWALHEPDQGKTLVRGRLVREYEFASSAWNGSGGLEGLVAAAQRGRDGTPTREDADGKGWGLEVVVSLKLVMSDGRELAQGRKEFEEMVARGPGQETTAAVMGSNQIGNGAAAGPSTARPPVRPPQQVQVAPRIDLPPASNQTLNPNPNPYPYAQQQPQNTAAAPLRIPQPQRAATSHQAQVLQASAPPRPSSTSSQRSQPSSMPPSSLPLPSSSLPMMSSSSAQGTSRPSSAADQRQSSLPPLSSATGTATPTLSTRHLPLPQTQPQSQPQPLAQPQRQPPQQARLQPPIPARQSSAPPQPDRSSRDVTPPPAPRPESPPPSTPSRAALHALLRSDAKMSPELAKQLVNNPALLRLLKSAPSSQLPPSFRPDQASTSTSSGSGQNQGDAKASPATSDFATPNSSVVQKTETGGCHNCGTTTSDVWRHKTMKNGQNIKVCNECGLYFNKHKRMRPAEVWSTQPERADKRAKLDDPPSGMRSSPRRHRQNEVPTHTNGQHHNHNHNPHPQPHGPVNPGNGNAQDHAPSLGSASNTSQASGATNGSPRKKKAKGPPPQPSPRRATRAAVKEAVNGSAPDVKREDAFSPSSMFLTSPIDPMSDATLNNFSALETNGANGVNGGNNPVTAFGTGADGSMTQLVNGTIGAEGDGEVDIEALLAQFVSSEQGEDGGLAAQSGEQLNLDALFAGMMGEGGEMGQDMLEFLSSAWDGQGGGQADGTGAQ